MEHPCTLDCAREGHLRGSQSCQTTEPTAMSCCAYKRLNTLQWQWHAGYLLHPETCKRSARPMSDTLGTIVPPSCAQQRHPVPARTPQAAVYKKRQAKGMGTGSPPASPAYHGHKDVAWLQVAVDEAVVVNERHACCNPSCNLQAVTGDGGFTQR